METFAYSPILELKARTNSFTSNASWRTGKTQTEEEGTWDYVTYHRVPNNTAEGTANIHRHSHELTNGQHGNNLEGMKTELVVIEEDLMDDKKSSLGWGVIALIVIAVLVILGAVGGVVVWQLGLFGSSKQPNSTAVEGQEKFFGDHVTKSFSNNRDNTTDNSSDYTNSYIETDTAGNSKDHLSSTKNGYMDEATNENINEYTTSTGNIYKDDVTTPSNSNDYITSTRKNDKVNVTTSSNSNDYRSGTKNTHVDDATTPSNSNDHESSAGNVSIVENATRKSKSIEVFENYTEVSENHITISENGEDSIIIDNNNLFDERHDRKMSVMKVDDDVLKNNPTKHSNEMVMVLIGGRNSSGSIHPGNEVIGGYRGPSSTRCLALESFTPKFEGNSGSVFIKRINAVVFCGYSNIISKEGRQEPKTESYIFHKSRSVWESAGYPLDKIGLSDGAFTIWWNRIILFGGYGHYGLTPTMSYSIKVFEFSSVEKAIITSAFEEDVEGSSEDDDEEVNYDEVFKFFLVEESHKVVSKGGIVGGCANTLEDHKQHVKFIVTGGIDKHEKVTAEAILFELIMVQNNPTVKHHRKIPNMTYERTRHGCTKTTLHGEDVVIVAGGGDINNLPIQHVEFINAKTLDRWRNLGNLNRGRMSSPSIGRVFGRLIVAGGRTLATAAVDGIDINNKIIATDSIELYDEETNRWRDVENKDEFNETKLSSPRYDHIGVLIPYAWCLSG